MQQVPGGVCAAKGFRAAGLSCGLKSGGNKDLALIASDIPCTAAATYTRNVVKAAPLQISKDHLSDGRLSAVVINSGNANACAPQGEENALAMCQYVAQELGIPTHQVAVASTGVIGVTMTPKMELVRKGISQLSLELSGDQSGSESAAQAIMTTDTVKKQISAAIQLGGKTVSIGGIAKGSGMIHPNMGTMLSFITTDAAISAPLLDRALKAAVNQSFNRISVDGDTSTNDFCLIMANGYAGNPEITQDSPDYRIFCQALSEICVYLAREMAADGEGATHLITCTVQGAPDEQTGELVGKSVISSSLVKSAIFGGDANWGRILCAMGYSGVDFDPDRVSVSFKSESGEVLLCEGGRGLAFDEELAAKVLAPREVIISIDMGQGSAACTCWGCDLTYDYVKINGDYRT